MSHPLAGLRVVELATDIAGPYATKLLADAGADVVKVEHPNGGDRLRRWTTTGAPLAAGEDGVLFRFLNTSKRSVAVAWERDEGRDRLRELVAAADVVIENTGAVDWTAVSSWNPRAPLVSISWFGRTGPWADRPATEFTVQAWSGATAIRGTLEHPPISAGGRLGEWLAGGYAAIGALAAVEGARQTGRGQHVDLSVLEAVHLSMAPFATVVASFGGNPGIAGRTVEIPSIEPAADGWVGFCTITNQQWRDFLVMIERGDLVDDPDLAHYFTRNERRHEVYAMIHEWTKKYRVADIIERATLLRIPVAPVGNGETVSTFDQFRARNVYVPTPDAAHVQPRPPYKLHRGTLRAWTPAPRLGQHTEECATAWSGRSPVAGAPGVAAPSDYRGAKAATPGVPAAGAHHPYRALRVIDFTMFWAGPFVGHFLATQGAEVIKVESIQRPDGIRFASTQQPTAERWWEWCGMFHGMNAGKRGITLDLSRPRGVDLARALIARADVVVENFSPRVLDNLGLRYDDLARDNPRLIMIRMPAFGLDGPWRDRTGFAQTMEQISGMAWTTGFADGPPVIPRGPCDPLAGMHAVVALQVALEHRRRTGEGQLVESTMVEAALNATADQLLEWQAYGRLVGRDGNRGPVGAPQNLYACRGAERWIAIAVTDDVEWSALVEVLGRPVWATSDGFATRAGRHAAREAIDEALAIACRAADRDELLAKLLAAGVPAAPAIHPSELTTNPQVRSRGFFQPMAHPVTGAHEIPGLPMRFSEKARWYNSPAPTLGQHTDAVLRELLGLGDDELARLRAEGIVGERPANL